MNQILDLARRQGYVTASDVKALGAHRMQLTRLVRSGDLIHTVRSVYLPAEPFKPEESHARVTRAILAADPFAAASHTTRRSPCTICTCTTCPGPRCTSSTPGAAA